MLLRPSNSSRWGPGGCPGSLALEAPFPDDEDSDAAREGTAAHFHLTEALQGRNVPIGAAAPNGVVIDQDMVDAAQHALRDIHGELLKLTDHRHTLGVERKLVMHRLIHPNNEGTPDVFLISPQDRLIVVWDFKYGHRRHHPFRHWQLVDYLAGVAESMAKDPAAMTDWSISLRIVQPRDYGAEPVKRWDFSGVLIPSLFEELRAAAHAATLPNAPLITGEHCRDCLAKTVCPALQALGGYILDLSRRPVPMDLSREAIGYTLREITTAMKRLEALQTGLQEVAIAMIQQGENIPLWRLGNADTRERWTTPADQVFFLGDVMGVELRKPQEPITPNQARQAGIDAAVIASYASKPAGAKKLLPADATAAARAFS